MLLRSVMSVYLQHIALLSASQRADNSNPEIDIYHEYKHCVVFLSAVCSAHNTSSIAFVPPAVLSTHCMSCLCV